MRTLAAVVVVGLAASVGAVAWAARGRGAPRSASCDGSDHEEGLQAETCVAGTGTVDHSVAASYDPSSNQGYAIYQGRPGDRVLPEGYVGADTQNGGTVVGCDTGTYDPRASDDWNQSPKSKHNNAQVAVGTDEFTAPVGPIGPGDPCSPFVPHTPPGSSCGSPQDSRPQTTAPGSPSPLNAYTSGSPESGNGQVGLAGDFGGGDGASGYLQVTYGSGDSAPTGNVTTGGNSKGGGGTVALGNDGRETDDPFTPAGSPVVVCQD
jgi:hypothetical protein